VLQPRLKVIEFAGGADSMEMKVSPEQRLRQALASHIRHGAKDFLAEGTFEHGGRDYVVALTKDGFQRNEILKSDFWWPGIYYFAKFDSDQVNFQLPFSKWRGSRPRIRPSPGTRSSQTSTRSRT